MKGIIPLASTSAFCLIGATTLAAAYYHDRWQWAMAGAAVLIGGVRVGVILVLASKVNCLTRTSGLLWARSFSVVTLLFCSLMGLITLYNFRYYDEPMQILCVMGTFALCSGISSRLGLQPRWRFRWPDFRIRWCVALRFFPQSQRSPTATPSGCSTT